ncbi:MAG: two-component regulator propeller domain-containing protein [Ferruginibacter sp.]
MALLFMVHVPVFAQAPAFYHLNTADGLSENNITSCAMDKNGILWIGTTEGLNSFDGNIITVYHKYKYPLLASNSIENIIVDTENRIWIRSTSGNINMLDEKRKFRLFKFGDSAENARVNHLFFSGSRGIIALRGKQHYTWKDKSGMVLEKLSIPGEDKLPAVTNQVGQVNGDTIFFYGDNKLVLYDYAAMKLIMSIPLAEIEGITAINPGELVAYTQDGTQFYRISIAQKKIVKEYRNLVDQYRLPLTGSLRSSIKIRDNLIVIASRYSGIYYIDFDTERVTNYVHDPLEPKSLGGNNTYRIRFDEASGYLFVTTLTSGLHYYNTRINQASYKSYFTDQNKDVFDGFIQSVTTANDGTVWMGAQDRLISWNRKTNKTVYVPCFLPGGINISRRETIRSVRFDEDDNLWVGTSTKGLLILNPQLKTIVHLTDNTAADRTIPSFWINAICRDTKGNMWVGTLRGTCFVEKKNFKVHDLSKHPLLSKISSIPCASIWVDKAGRIWIGTVRGAWCYDENKNTLTQYSTEQGLAHNTVYATNEDNIGNYYFATAAGFSVLSKDGKIKSYNRSNGLRNDRCEGIQKDEKGFLWIGNLSCILRYDPETKTFAVYEDGYGYRMRTSHKTSNGEMFWGTDKGLAFFYPGEMNSISQPLNPSVNTLRISDSAYRFTGEESLSFPYNTSSFVFNFSSGELSGGKKTQLLYRLAGYDNDWKSPVTAGQAAYSKLLPGKYRFEIRASRDGNTWYDAAYPIGIFVQKPWWQQTWFRLLCLLAALAVFIFSYRQFKKRKQQKEAQQVIDYFAGSAYEKSSVENILWDICRNCIYMLRFEDCVIYLLDEEKNVLVQKAAYGPKNPKAFEIINPLHIPLGKGIVGHVAVSGKAAIIADTSKDDRYIMDDEKRLSEIAVPIIHEGKVIGVIDSEHPKKNFFTGHHLKTLQSIASLCSAKISHAIALGAMKKSELELMELNVKMAESRFLNLRLQMNPHFLFNSLSSIQHLIVSQQTTKAYKYLTVFSNFLRSLLNFADRNFVPLDDELKILKMYIELESLRFDESFTYEITVDESLTNDEILLPSLMVQPFAENAIWHGLLHKEGDKKLSIRFTSSSDEFLTCIIEDNGIGRTRSAAIRKNRISVSVHESKGIGIIEERLNLMQQKTGKPAHVEITDMYNSLQEPAGTKVIITIPYYNPEES